MDPSIHTDVLPGIQDGYSLAFSDFLGADISCYPSMQSDLHAGICVNDSEVRLPATFRYFFSHAKAFSEVLGNNYCISSMNSILMFTTFPSFRVLLSWMIQYMGLSLILVS
jgi:hypothetical protein